eukprot:m.313823 g.313823  ORF g.313823 m.313823 type:complete len:109 (-) comp20261_c0_seq1:284-610(-)
MVSVVLRLQYGVVVQVVTPASSRAASIQFDLSDTDGSNIHESMDVSSCGRPAVPLHSRKSAAAQAKYGNVAQEAHRHFARLNAEFCDIDDFALVEEEFVDAQDTSRLR